jgi:hypothetical protein
MKSKVLAYVTAAIAVAGFATAGVAPALAAAPPPSCDLRLGKTVSNAHPVLGHSVTFTLRVFAKCVPGSVVTVGDTLPPGLAQDPPGEALSFRTIGSFASPSSSPRCSPPTPPRLTTGCSPKTAPRG